MKNVNLMNKATSAFETGIKALKEGDLKVAKECYKTIINLVAVHAVPYGILADYEGYMRQKMIGPVYLGKHCFGFRYNHGC